VHCLIIASATGDEVSNEGSSDGGMAAVAHNMSLVLRCLDSKKQIYERIGFVKRLHSWSIQKQRKVI
jgi:hypothetical protein